MRFEALPTLDHPSVDIRPIARADLPAWLGYLQQPEVYQHTSWNHPTLDELSTYVWSSAMQEPAHLVRFALVSRQSGELVGTIGFHSVMPADRRAEVAFDLSPAFWGRGIAAFACEQLVRWAHERAHILRVQATVLESNARSSRVVERAGFEQEGLLRSYRLVRGTPGNFFMYSHLAPGRPVT